MGINEARTVVGDYVTLIRGTTYKGALVGKPGPALLGLGSIVPGGGFRTEDFQTYGGDCPPELILSPGDIYASLKGATKDGKMIGSVARVPHFVQSGRITQDTVKLVFRHPAPEDISFLHWVLRTPHYRDYCAGHAMGSAVVALSRSDFLKYPVPPPSAYRRAIVALLDALDDKIELNRRLAATLEKMARALFKSWFVDFDPVHANANRRNLGFSAGVADLFSGRFGENGLPEGWKQEVLRPSLAELVTRGVAPAYVDNGLTVLNQKCIRNGRIDFAQARHHDQTARKVPDAKLLRTGDILINSTGSGTLGRVAQVRRLDVTATVDTHVTIVRPSGDQAWSNYLGLQFLTREAEIERLGDGSTGQTELARDAVANLSVLVPPSEVLIEFAEVTLPLIERSEAAHMEIEHLRELRDALLPKLISGELRIKNVDSAVEAA